MKKSGVGPGGKIHFCVWSRLGKSDLVENLCIAAASRKNEFAANDNSLSDPCPEQIGFKEAEKREKTGSFSVLDDLACDVKIARLDRESKNKQVE